MGCCLFCPTCDCLLSSFCEKMLPKASGRSLTVSGSSYWILAKSKFLILALLEGDLQAYSWDSVPPPDCRSFTQFKLQQKCTSLPRLEVSGITVLLFWKHVLFVSKHSHTCTWALHTANKYRCFYWIMKAEKSQIIRSHLWMFLSSAYS